jgi:hypothetical protein
MPDFEAALPNLKDGIATSQIVHQVSVDEE